MVKKHKPLTKKSVTVGSKVYVKLVASSPERLFIVNRILDKTWIEIEDFDGKKHVINWSKVHVTPTKKKTPERQRGRKSISTISIPIGGQPKKPHRGLDSLSEMLREQRQSRKKKR